MAMGTGLSWNSGGFHNYAHSDTLHVLSLVRGSLGFQNRDSLIGFSTLLLVQTAGCTDFAACPLYLGYGHLVGTAYQFGYHTIITGVIQYSAT